jgi:hypothetical protein
VAAHLKRLRSEGTAEGEGLSTAEYLDTVRACLRLGVTPDSPQVWPLLARVTLLKNRGRLGQER